MSTAIWHEFVAFLKTGSFPADKLLPHHAGLKEPLLRFLEQMHAKANWEECAGSPEVHENLEQIHYLTPLTFDGQRKTFCFSFLIAEDQWYFQHMESITLRFDQLAPLPTTTFPDISESQKAWIREEVRVSEQVRVFTQLVREKGRTHALAWFRDGAGYVLAAKTWVPSVPLARAFILYLCWEQANLRGNKVTLQVPEERRARVIV